jgi:hypothetical protein
MVGDKETHAHIQKKQRKQETKRDLITNETVKEKIKAIT